MYGHGQVNIKCVSVLFYTQSINMNYGLMTLLNIEEKRLSSHLLIFASLKNKRAHCIMPCSFKVVL